MRPSQILRKLAAYPRQNELAAALREVGRMERSLFMIDWTTDPGLRRRVQVGLNKGEAHHALKRAINFHQRGELRDRTGEGNTTGSPASTCWINLTGEYRWPRVGSTGDAKRLA